MRTLLFIVLIISSAQNISGKNVLDAKFINMKTLFTNTVKTNFTIVNDTIKPDKQGVDHWLVTAKPKKAGFYTIRHIYQNQDGWAYKNNSHEYQISVSPEGTSRFIDYHNRRIIKQACFDLWLGDAITIPISLDKHIISHAFSDESRHGPDHNFDKEQIHEYKSFIAGDFLKWDIINKITELDFIGVKLDKIVHRSLTTSTLNYYAIFSAKEPGKFNLNVDKYQSIPLTILPKNGSIKTLAGHASIYEWNDQGGSSSTAKSFWLENVPLRTGDILMVFFMGYTEKQNNKRKINKKLTISKTDFSMQNKGYDYWIND